MYIHTNNNIHGMERDCKMCNSASRYLDTSKAAVKMATAVCVYSYSYNCHPQSTLLRLKFVFNRIIENVRQSGKQTKRVYTRKLKFIK